ncbi:hypothetical protein [Xylophilus sp. GOD-11R]|uniref:hypothetical protein n=1 Tax=Xylophilus sp. GOD-11R TaxID=3089814 RepID=UPI00298C0130|nr:hypothetical protein [Xylophilus sp. GOD-11R]WPB59282.1 hypothetical protein R9X41_11805 [Xylophilus sp. GOD-11R]
MSSPSITTASKPPDRRTLLDQLSALEAENIRLRAALIRRESELAFARQDRDELAASVPGLPRRLELARTIESLGERLQTMKRERLHRLAPAAHVVVQRSRLRPSHP